MAIASPARRFRPPSTVLARHAVLKNELHRGHHGRAPVHDRRELRSVARSIVVMRFTNAGATLEVLAVVIHALVVAEGFDPLEAFFEFELANRMQLAAVWIATEVGTGMDQAVKHQSGMLRAFGQKRVMVSIHEVKWPCEWSDGRDVHAGSLKTA